MKDTKLNYTLNILARWFVGLVFLFSSFVKGVDPLGTSFKIQEYMTAWSIGSFTFEWALPFATFLSVALITAEFLVGVLLITNSFRRFSSWLLVLMMLFFTVTTFIDALTNKVTDCGCFGDAVKLTNWQTFWKNIVLDVPTVWILLTRDLRRKRRFERDTIVLIFACAAMVVFSLYNIYHEPCIDFRPWKVGNRMTNTDPSLRMESFVRYRNLETNEEIEVPSVSCYEYEEDKAHWLCIGTRVVDPHEIAAPGFSMLDLNDDDWAVDLIGSPDSIVIATIHHLDDVDDDGTEALRAMAKWAEEEGVQLVLLTSSLPEQVQAYLHEAELENLDFYFADATAIETMARSNPGFVLLQDGVVLGKWNYRSIDRLIEE